MKLAQYFGVSTDYLLGLTKKENHLNPEEKSLDLSDTVVDMLFLKQINVRSLCELMEHPLFPLFMTDLEVFVDGYVTMQLHNLNLPLEQVQKMVREKYQVADLPTLDDISQENTEEKALRRILALQGYTPEEMTQEDREESLGILRKYNGVWGTKVSQGK